MEFQDYLTILGGIMVFCSFGPQFWFIFQKRNTVDLNKKMFYLHMCVSFFYGISSLLNIISKLISGSIGESVLFIILALINVTLFLACYFMISVKWKNENFSKKEGISELDHYKKYLEGKKFGFSYTFQNNKKSKK